MNFLIVSSVKSIKQAIIGSFMPLGVDIFYANSYSEAERILFSKDLSMIFIDLDVSDSLEYGLMFIDEILEEKANNLPIIVVVSTKSNRKLVEQLVRKRVKGFLVKPIDETVIVNRLINLKKRFHYIDTDKKYYRVTPPVSQPLNIYIRSPRTSRLIKGRIKNINLGGASFEALEPVLDEDIVENDSIDKIIVKFSGVDANFGGKLLYKLDRVCAVSFRNYDDENIRLLSNYIFDHIDGFERKQ